MLQKYMQPPKEMVELIEAPPTPAIHLDPARKWMLVMKRPNYISVSELSQPELRLAGIRFNPDTHAPGRDIYYTSLLLKRIENGREYEIKGLPENCKIRYVRWSPNGKYVAFTQTCDKGVELWLISTSNKHARRLTKPIISVMYASPFRWVSDSQSLLCQTIVAERGPAPKESRIPAGPIIQENLGKKTPARTYQDLLKDEYDIALFDYYFTTQLIKIDIKGSMKPIGKPAIFGCAAPSPDGKYILIEQVHKPYSYLVPVDRFPMAYSIWDNEGNLVAQLADLPLAEDVPISRNAVRKGPRGYSWRADQSAAIYWVEAKDDGDPKNKVEIRDVVYLLAAPFDGNPQELIQLKQRFSSAIWSEHNYALISEWWWETRNKKTWLVDFNRPLETPRLIFDLSFEDRYNDPGQPMRKSTAVGTRVLNTGGAPQIIYLLGEGASEEGNRPFIDEFNLLTGETTRLWRSQPPFYEFSYDFIDSSNEKLLIRRESVDIQPNFYIYNRKTGEMRQFTNFPHPSPQLRKVKKELIQYERADGVKLTATL